MPLVIPCPSCGARLKAPENLIGKTVKCPNCQTAIAVKAPASAPTPARQPAAVKAPRKPAPVEEYDDLEEERPARRPAPRKSRDDDEYTDAPPPRKSKARPQPEDDLEEVDDRDNYDEDDRPRKKGKKSKEYTPPGGSTTDQERTNAMLVYVAAIVTNFIGFGPLGGIVWWLIKRGESKFVDHHGKEFLNLLITGFLVAMGCFLIGVVGGVLGAVTESAILAFIGIGLAILLMAVVGLLQLVFFIIALLKAKSGVWYRIPMILHILKV
jgi:uncharacterized Tic20 family protein